MNLKNKILCIMLIAASIKGFSQSNCKDLKACERKLCELNIKLSAAKKAGNQNQIKGVENAIHQTNKNCTAKKVNNDLADKVQEKRQKVSEKTVDLNQAIKDQQSKEKIDKKRKKLNEAQKELNSAIEDQQIK